MPEGNSSPPSFDKPFWDYYLHHQHHNSHIHRTRDDLEHEELPKAFYESCEDYRPADDERGTCKDQPSSMTVYHWSDKNSYEPSQHTADCHPGRIGPSGPAKVLGHWFHKRAEGRMALGTLDDAGENYYEDNPPAVEELGASFRIWDVGHRINSITYREFIPSSPVRHSD